APFFKENNPMADIQKGEYLTDILTNKTVDFIDKYDKKQPFLLVHFYYSVHGPQLGRKDWVERYKKEGFTGKYAEYGGMISTVDESVGRIRAALKEKGIADNTIIIFTSDQGGFFTNAPLSGGKIGGNTLGEGGCRVPFIAFYPGVTKKGSTTDVPIQTLDVFPTLVEIASGKKCVDKGINGKSLMPLIKGEKFPKRDLFFFRSYEDQYTSIISGDWKLIKYHSGLYHLFNVTNDISEKNDLINKDLKEADLLKKKLNKWEKEVVKIRK
ncbi:MAG: sulfatase-like hydrolase/transferase, partial [Bacteroidales bacterium]